MPRKRCSLHVQTAGRQFTRVLSRELRDQRWKIVEMAVAWVRRSGAREVTPALRQFLKRGGVLRIIVGIDIENTSKEGLQGLLALEKRGDVGVFVYHNESPSVTFHPKLYLFRNDVDAKLIVGSNNLTEGGLATNIEASLEVEGPSHLHAIVKAVETLGQWRTLDSLIVRPLNQRLLRDLVSEGYVLSEARLRKRRASLRKGLLRRKRRRLFGSETVAGLRRARRRRKVGLRQRAPKNAERILLMRVRKASRKARPTQTQLPKAVYQSGFFSGVDTVTSAHDGRGHGVQPAWARGIINTLKLEIPEMRRFADPVLRLTKTPDGIIYEAHDRLSRNGSRIFLQLRDGLASKPPLTQLTVPARPSQSTWWRFFEKNEVPRGR